MIETTLKFLAVCWWWQAVSIFVLYPDRCGRRICERWLGYSVGITAIAVMVCCLFL